MRQIDQLYTKWPFLGSRRLSVYLSRQGWQVNRKRVQRLMRLMGLEAIYPEEEPEPQRPGGQAFSVSFARS